MNQLKYFKQEQRFTCNLANLRSVLDWKGIEVSEQTLIDQIKVDYQLPIVDVWNPTIAMLATHYGVKTKMIALWKLFEPKLLDQALSEYQSDSEYFDPVPYESSSKSTSKIPLPISYKYMFQAIKDGCEVEDQALNEKLISATLNQNQLIQTTIKLAKLYPGKKNTYHSILLHGLEGDRVVYNDPTHGENLEVSLSHLFFSLSEVNVGMIYSDN